MTQLNHNSDQLEFKCAHFKINSAQLKLKHAQILGYHDLMLAYEANICSQHMKLAVYPLRKTTVSLCECVAAVIVASQHACSPAIS